MDNVVLISIIGGANWRLLPHWLAHYRRLGVRRHVIAINDDDRYDLYAGLLARSGITPAESISGLYATQERVHRPRLASYARPQDWVIYADLDELFLFPKPLPRLIAELESGAGDYVLGPLIDHVAAEGRLPPVRPRPSLWRQFPHMYAITYHVRKGGATKVMLRRAGQPMCRGNHGAPATYRRHPLAGEVHHFRWDETVVPRIREFLTQWPQCDHRREFENTLRYLSDPPRWNLPALEFCRIPRAPLLSKLRARRRHALGVQPHSPPPENQQTVTQLAGTVSAPRAAPPGGNSTTQAVRIAVLGLYRSGTSAIAGVLHRLGVDMGAPFWGNYYEPADLANVLRQWWDEPRLIETATRAVRVQYLRRWLADRERRGVAPVGAKHPLLCLCGVELREAWGSDVRFVWARRPLAESIQSLTRLGWFPNAAGVQHKLWAASQAFLANQPSLPIEYEQMRSDPNSTVYTLIEQLSLSPTAQQIDAAIRSIRPNHALQARPQNLSHGVLARGASTKP